MDQGGPFPIAPILSQLLHETLFGVLRLLLP